MLRKGFLRHKTPENIIRKDVEFSTPFSLFSIGLIYSWQVAPQQSSFTLQSNKAKISNLNYIYNVSKLVTTYHKTLLLNVLIELIEKTFWMPIFFFSLEHVYEVTEPWKEDYNQERPHEALNYCTPNEYAA